MKKIREITKIGGILGIIVVAIVFLPFKIPYTIESPGKIKPVQEWGLVRGEDGRLMETLYNYKVGTIPHFTITQFERGDIIDFSLRPSISTGSFIFANDTVGTIYSSNLERDFVNLNSELKIAQALLVLNRRGQKKSIVRASQERYHYNLQKIAEHKKIVDRTRQLYEEGLTTKEDYEIAEGKLKLFNFDASIAEAQMNATQTGVKAEEIDLLRIKIKTLEDKLLTLQKRAASFMITSQISGKVARVFSNDTLLMIIDTSAFFVFIPIEWDKRKYLRAGQNVEFTVNGIQSIQTGKVTAIDNSIFILNGRQVFFISAVIENQDINIFPGMMVSSKIYCEPVPMTEYIKRGFQEAL